MRVPLGIIGRQADHFQQFGDTAGNLVRRHDAIKLERPADDRADPLTRIERGIRMLEDQLHAAAIGPVDILAGRKGLAAEFQATFKVL